MASESFQKRSSQIFLGIFIGVIIISFMFTGNFGSGGTPDSIGGVGPHSIKVREFNAEVQRQSQFYSQFMKSNQPLSSQEMKQFKVYDNAIQNLVMNKLRLILADEVGVHASLAAVKDDIKGATYFKTGENFDVRRYKALLSYNKITPQDFELETENKLKGLQLQSLLTQVHFSKDLKTKINELYNDTRKVTIATLNFNELRKTLNITDKEVSAYLAKENNKKKVESLFNQRKSSLGKGEEAKVRHILFAAKKDGSDLKKATELRKKVTAKNFIELAKKNTDEPSGKKTGGALNWIEKGQMVKEFESVAFAMKKGEISQPIKTKFGYHIVYVEDKRPAVIAQLSVHESKIATELIQGERDIKDLIAAAKKDIMASMTSKKILNSAKKKYRISLKEDISINRLEGLDQNYAINEKDMAKIFTESGKVHSFDEALKTTFIVATSDTKTTNKEYSLESSKNIANQQNLKAMLDNLSKTYTFERNKLARLPN